MLKSKQCEQDLLTFKRYADECNVRFFLILGTCLGAIRENEFIENDDDLDIGILAEDKNTNLLFDKLRTKYQTYTRTTNGVVAGLKVFMINKVDLNLLYLVGDKRYYIKDCKYDKFYGKDYPKKFFDNPKEISFIGSKFYVPNPPEEYLEYLYGDWRTPTSTKSHRDLVRVPL